jgi:phosphatidylglycerol:prolipoprotein diacylglycerol transferase
MRPILFEYSFITVRTSYLFWIAAVSLFMFWTRSRAVIKYGLDRNRTTNTIVWTFFAAAAGALFFDFFGKTVLLFTKDPSFSGFFPAELASSGGILFGGLAGIYKSYREKLRWNDFADAAMIPAASAIAIWRLGCFFDGCCRGIIFESSWLPWFAVHYPDDPASVFRYPYPLIESAFMLLLMLFLTSLEKIFLKKRASGHTLLTPLFILAYGAFRLLTDHVREEGLRNGGMLIFACFVLIGALASLFTIYRSVHTDK